MLSFRGWLLRAPAKNRRRLFEAATLPPCRNLVQRPSVGIIVIGDEILKAQVKDTNSFYACGLLYKHGVKVKKISVIGDDVQAISREIDQFSKAYAYVVTTGGIGPTHDDLTYQALAHAFNDTLHYHPTLVKILGSFLPSKSLSSPGYKMAYVPKKATLKFIVDKTTGKKLRFPCVALGNVHVFPGSPIFFEKSFQSFCEELFYGRKGFATTEIYVNAREESFADILSKVAEEYPNVCFGSYPDCSRNYKVRITVESDDTENMENAKERFCGLVPRDVLVHFDRAPHIDCFAKFQKFLRRSQNRALYESFFEKIVDLYRNPQEVTIYLDGSVESTILIHMARTVGTKMQSGERLHAICFDSDKLRPGMDHFFREIVERYAIELNTLRYADDVSRTIDDLCREKPGLRMLLLGKRSIDRAERSCEGVARFGKLERLEVHYPLIDWRNEDIETLTKGLCLFDFASEEYRCVRTKDEEP